MSITAQRKDSVRFRAQVPSASPDAFRWPRLPLPIQLAAWGVLGFTLLILAVMTIARTGTIPPIFEPSALYRPGHILPDDVTCYAFSDDHLTRCMAEQLDHKIYFDFDRGTNVIRRTFIPAREYALGTFLTSWGPPTGMTQMGHTIYIYWQNRFAMVYTRSLRPTSRVDFIVYDRDPQAAFPWRGFTNHNR